MNIAVMTVNDWTFHPNGRLGEEAEKLGHRLSLINPYEMGCMVGSQSAGVYFRQGKGGPDLPDLVMPRQGAPMGEYGFVLLNQFAGMGVPLVNGMRGVAIARNQFLTLQHLVRSGLPVPDSCFAVSRESVIQAVDRLGGYPVVAKQVDGMGGDGVVKLGNREETEAVLETGFDPRRGLVIQAYIPTRGRQDIRLMVIGGRVAGAMALTPAPGRFKSNLHQQGRAEALDPEAELSRMAVTAARACHLDVAGVDMMVDAGGRVVLSEVNYSPGFRGMEQATGLNIAGDILAAALAVAARQKSQAAEYMAREGDQ